MKRQAAHAISNACAEATESQIRQMVDLGAIHCLVEMIHETDAETTSAVIKGLDNILSTGESDEDRGRNEFLDQFNALDGARKLSALETCGNGELAAEAQCVIDKFYDIE